MHLLILGCGDIGTRVGFSMREAGWHVSAARRHASKLSERFDRYQVDLTDPVSMARVAGVRPRLYSHHANASVLRSGGVSQWLYSGRYAIGGTTLAIGVSSRYLGVINAGLSGGSRWLGG